MKYKFDSFLTWLGKVIGKKIQIFHSIAVCTYKSFFCVDCCLKLLFLNFIDAGRRIGFDTYCTCFNNCNIVHWLSLLETIAYNVCRTNLCLLLKEWDNTRRLHDVSFWRGMSSTSSIFIFCLCCKELFFQHHLNFSSDWNHVSVVLMLKIHLILYSFWMVIIQLFDISKTLSIPDLFLEIEALSFNFVLKVWIQKWQAVNRYQNNEHLLSSFNSSSLPPSLSPDITRVPFHTSSSS